MAYSVLLINSWLDEQLRMRFPIKGKGSSISVPSNYGLRSKWMNFEDVHLRLRLGDLVEISLGIKVDCIFSRTGQFGFVPLPYKHWVVITRFQKGIPYAVHFSDIGESSSSLFFPQRSEQSINRSQVREEILNEIVGSSKCRINNSRDWTTCPFHTNEVVKRGLSKVGEGSFNLYTNNCEHLARWIRNGKSSSSQTFSISGFMSGMSGGPDSLIGIITPKLHDVCDHETNYPPVYVEYENELILLTIFFILFGFPLLVFAILLT